MTLQVIRAYAVNKAWVIGFLMDIFGALLMLRALSQAPVSLLASTYIIVVVKRIATSVTINRNVEMQDFCDSNYMNLGMYFSCTNKTSIFSFLLVKDK